MNKKTIVIYFNECEHNGDLDQYINDIQTSGGKVTSRIVDESNETGRVVVEITDDFKKRFKETEAYLFSTLNL